MPAALPDSYLSLFAASADAALAAEEDFRRGYVARLQALERKRAFAHRRLSLMKTLAAAMGGDEVPDEAEAQAAAAQVLQHEFGLDAGREVHQPILAAFAPVVAAIRATMVAEPPADPASVPAAMAAFETWYEAHTGTPFMALYDVYVQETPVVDW